MEKIKSIIITTAIRIQIFPLRSKLTQILDMKSFKHFRTPLIASRKERTSRSRAFPTFMRDNKRSKSGRDFQMQTQRE